MAIVSRVSQKSAVALPYELGDELSTSTVGCFFFSICRSKISLKRSLFYLNISAFFLKICRNEIVMAILSWVSQRALWLRRISLAMNFQRALLAHFLFDLQEVKYR